MNDDNKGMDWKWIVTALCIPVIGYFILQYNSNTEARFQILHKRINDMDSCKVEKELYELQNVHIIETLNEIKADVKELKRRNR